MALKFNADSVPKDFSSAIQEFPKIPHPNQMTFRKEFKINIALVAHLNGTISEQLKNFSYFPKG